LPLPSWGGSNFVDAGFKGYGAIVDRQQRLWVAGAPGDYASAVLTLLNAATGQVVNTLHAPANYSQSYGIGIDGQDRVWLANWCPWGGQGTRAFRYAHPQGLIPDAGVWTLFDFSDAGIKSQLGTAPGLGRGIAVDKEGIVWMSMDQHYSGTSMAGLIAFDSNDGGLLGFPKAGGGSAGFMDVTSGAGSPYDAITGGKSNQSIGVAIDSDENIWVNNYGGDVMRFNRDAGTFNFGVPQPGANFYSYSDFTGYELNNYTAPKGSFTLVFSGCANFATWNSITVQDSIPAGTTISMMVSSSNSMAFPSPTAYVWNLADGTNVVNLQSAPGPVPMGTNLEVTFTLTTQDKVVAPSLFGVSYSVTCNNPPPT
jgi:hypothetical protein